MAHLGYGESLSVSPSRTPHAGVVQGPAQRVGCGQVSEAVEPKARLVLPQTVSEARRAAARLVMCPGVGR